MKSGINLDVDRASRTGLDEAIFCAGKTPAQIAEIVDRSKASQSRMLLTRLCEAKYSALAESQRALLQYDPDSATAFVGEQLPTVRSEPAVCVVSAGSSDASVSLEASRTLEYYGEPVSTVLDVGVAGLWRLLERLEEIRESSVIIAVAGMDAALPTVLGGLVPGVLIAVPTSVGYGAAHGGQTAMNALLTSCAPGITVVNIDNGYGAACAAMRVLGALKKC